MIVAYHNARFRSDLLDDSITEIYRYLGVTRMENYEFEKYLFVHTNRLLMSKTATVGKRKKPTDAVLVKSVVDDMVSQLGPVFQQLSLPNMAFQALEAPSASGQPEAWVFVPPDLRTTIPVAVFGRHSPISGHWYWFEASLGLARTVEDGFTLAIDACLAADIEWTIEQLSKGFFDISKGSYVAVYDTTISGYGNDFNALKDEVSRMTSVPAARIVVQFIGS